MRHGLLNKQYFLINPQVQRQRVLARPGMTEQKFDDILKRQLPDEEKRQRGDYIINTNCSLEETHTQVMQLIEIVKEKEGTVARVCSL